MVPVSCAHPPPPQNGILGGWQKVYVEKIYVLFLSLVVANSVSWGGPRGAPRGQMSPRASEAFQRRFRGIEVWRSQFHEIPFGNLCFNPETGHFLGPKFRSGKTDPVQFKGVSKKGPFCLQKWQVSRLRYRIFLAS